MSWQKEWCRSFVCCPGEGAVPARLMPSPSERTAGRLDWSEHVSSSQWGSCWLSEIKGKMEVTADCLEDTRPCPSTQAPLPMSCCLLPLPVPLPEMKCFTMGNGTGKTPGSISLSPKCLKSRVTGFNWNWLGCIFWFQGLWELRKIFSHRKIKEVFGFCGYFFFAPFNFMICENIIHLVKFFKCHVSESNAKNVRRFFTCAFNLFPEKVW